MHTGRHGTIRRSLTLAASIGALLTLAPAAKGAGAWGTVETVSRLPGPASAAIDDRGYIVLAWSRGVEVTRRVYGARRTPTRGFGDPFGLHTAGEARTWRSVTFDSQRNAIVAWHRQADLGSRVENRTESRTVRPNGARTDTTVVADIVGAEPHFAAVAPGTLAAHPVLGWGVLDRVDLARARDGRLTDAQREEVIDGDDYGFEEARFALTSDETVVAALYDGPLFVTERPPGGSFGPRQQISQSGQFAADPRLAIGPDGTIAAVWEGPTAEGRSVFASARPPDGQFSPPMRVSAPDERPLDFDVVVTTDGIVRVAYLAARYDDIRPIGPVRLATLAGERETLTPTGLDAADLRIAADGRGGTTVAWQRSGYGSPGQGNAIFARAITPSGRVGKRSKLTRTGEDGTDLELAVAPDGSALVAWTSGEGLLGDRLRAVRRGRTGD